MDYVTLWTTAFSYMAFQFFAGALLVLVVTRTLQRWGINRRIQKEWPPLRQYIVEAVIALRSLALNAWCFLLVTYLQFNGYFPANPTGGMLDPWWQVALDCLIMFIAHDAYFYWTHRIMHHPRLFRAMHLEHHLARTPTPFTTMRMTIAESFVQSGFFVLWAYFMPDSRISFEIVLAYIVFIGSVGHCGFEYALFNFARWPVLRHVASVTYHDMHHLGSYHHNYAIHFTWWDRLFGSIHPDYENKIDRILARRAQAKHAAPLNAAAAE